MAGRGSWRGVAVKIRPRPTLIPGRVIAGRLEVSIGDMAAAVRDWPDVRLVVRIEPERSRRTLKQLATWWGLWLDITARETGSDADELHEYVKQHFMPARHIQFVNADGELIEDEIRTTSKLDTSEMADMMEKGRAWMQSFFGVTLPDPDPNWRQRRGTE